MMFHAKQISALLLFCRCSRAYGFSVVAPSHSNPLMSSKNLILSSGGRVPNCVLYAASEDASAPSAPAPTLNGKRILPYKIMKGGLKDSNVAAVYALLNDEYKRGSEGWENVVHVGITKNLDVALEEHMEKFGDSKVAHVRALSFSFPDLKAMEEVAVTWRNSVIEAGGPVLNAADYLFDDEDDDDDDGDDDAFEFDDDEDEWDPSMAAGASATMASNGDKVVSPFDPKAEETANNEIPITSEGELPLTRENVDKVLDEVRPYLIADGGNVAVEGIDEEMGEVFLKLQGACGSCASSTVTMEMGIERVLREHFAGFTKVVQVESPGAAVMELTWEIIEEEFNRIYPAIVAMGGVAKIVEIDPDLGVVKMTFRGSNKVRQGLELAILDVPHVNRVEFIMEEN